MGSRHIHKPLVDSQRWGVSPLGVDRFGGPHPPPCCGRFVGPVWAPWQLITHHVPPKKSRAMSLHSKRCSQRQPSGRVKGQWPQVPSSTPRESWTSTDPLPRGLAFCQGPVHQTNLGASQNEEKDTKIKWAASFRLPSTIQQRVPKKRDTSHPFLRRATTTTPSTPETSPATSPGAAKRRSLRPL